MARTTPYGVMLMAEQREMGSLCIFDLAMITAWSCDSDLIAASQHVISCQCCDCRLNLSGHAPGGFEPDALWTLKLVPYVQHVESSKPQALLIVLYCCNHSGD